MLSCLRDKEMLYARTPDLPTPDKILFGRLSCAGHTQASRIHDEKTPGGDAPFVRVEPSGLSRRVATQGSLVHGKTVQRPCSAGSAEMGAGLISSSRPVYQDIDVARFSDAIDWDALQQNRKEVGMGVRRFLRGSASTRHRNKSSLNTFSVSFPNTDEMGPVSQGERSAKSVHAAIRRAREASEVCLSPKLYE